MWKDGCRRGEGVIGGLPLGQKTVLSISKKQSKESCPLTPKALFLEPLFPQTQPPHFPASPQTHTKRDPRTSRIVGCRRIITPPPECPGAAGGAGKHFSARGLFLQTKTPQGLQQTKQRSEAGLTEVKKGNTARGQCSPTPGTPCLRRAPWAARARPGSADVGFQEAQGEPKPFPAWGSRPAAGMQAQLCPEGVCVCVCVCDRERERERQRQRETKRERDVH